MSEIQNEVRKEVTSQVARSTVTAFALLLGFALIGWWFYLQDKITEIAGGVPSGAVMAFDITSCDELPGWVTYTKAQSRFILGAGPKSDDENLSKRSPGAEGGSEVLKSNLEHNHTYSAQYRSFTVIGAGPNDVVVPHGRQFPATGAESLSTGKNGSERPSIMPPFTVLTYCEKT